MTENIVLAPAPNVRHTDCTIWLIFRFVPTVKESICTVNHATALLFLTTTLNKLFATRRSDLNTVTAITHVTSGVGRL